MANLIREHITYIVYPLPFGCCKRPRRSEARPLPFMIDRFSRFSCFQIIAPRTDARFMNPKYILFLAITCVVLTPSALASPAVTDAEQSIASLSHPHGAQYSFRLSDSASQTIGEYRHIPVCRSRLVL